MTEQMHRLGTMVFLAAMGAGVPLLGKDDESRRYLDLGDRGGLLPDPPKPTPPGTYTRQQRRAEERASAKRIRRMGRA